MQAQTTIPARFNGPPASGNGGYSCGVLASHIQGPARIRLHVPPPLDTVLLVTRTADGRVEMFNDDTLVGSGEPTVLHLDVPEPPKVDEALAAMDRFPCYQGHIFPTCFVCGPERPRHDGLALFPGPVPERALWACVWRPAADLLDTQGNIRAEILWSALDCPGYFAALGTTLRPAVLGELVGELRRPVADEESLVVYAWPLGEDGRKYYAGTAIATSDGEIVACARSTWIVLKT
jgi:hypothetical protein